MTKNTEELEIELDDETAAIANYLAEKKGITIEELLVELLTEAINNGDLKELGKE